MTAVQVAYVGTKYSGLQKNPGQETIELALEGAFHAAGLVADCNFGDQHKVHWSRAARTDKGVHALGNVVSLKLLYPPAVDMVAATNKHLPSDILILDMKRVTKGFNAKNQAEGRKYQYLIPTYAFMPSPRPDREKCQTFADDDMPAWMRADHNVHKYSPTQAEIDAARAYRISEELEKQVDSGLRIYEGTHKFHNFTSGKKATDASASRYIISFRTGAKLMYSGVEFLELLVEGQSFMIHQIRKMIGLVVFSLRYGLDIVQQFKLACEPQKIMVPLAPSAGLLLHKVIYSQFAQRFPHVPSLEFEDVKEQMEEFKSKSVHPAVVARELQDNCTLVWLNELEVFHYQWLQILNFKDPQ